MIKKHSLFSHVILFEKLCFSDKNRSYFDDIIFFENETNEITFFQIFLKKGDIKFVGYYGNENIKLKTYQCTIMDELLYSYC